MLALAVVSCVLAVSLPVTVWLCVSHNVKATKEFLAHSRETQVVGGHPVDVFRAQALQGLEDRRALAERKAPPRHRTVEEILS